MDYRLCAVSPLYLPPVGYLYDAEGQRVAKGSIKVPDGSFDPCDMTANGFRMITEYIAGPTGEPMTELDWTSGQPVWAHTNASAGGRLVATYTNDGAGGSNLHFQMADWLGTRRLQTDYAGNPEETCSGGSFGDALNCVPVGHAADATEQHFTGKERDQESGLDYFGARYFGSSMGRFMSPDPLGGHLELPQSLNKYSYVMNNPLTLTDPTGLDFSLGCTKDNGTTCQSGSTYYKDDKGNYQQTRISSDDKGNLSDQIGNSYTANVSGSGVTFSGNGGSNVAGTFVNGTNATTINGSGALSGFTFNFTNSDVAAHLSAQGTFTYSGNASQAITALQNAGFQHYTPDELDFLHPSTTDYTAYDMRGVGGPDGTGAGHVVVQQPMSTDFIGWSLQRTPLVTLPTRGTADIGTTNPYSGGAQGFFNHVGEAMRHIF